MAKTVKKPGTVLVVGATGSVGRHVVAEAVRQGYETRALVRDSSRAGRLDASAQRVVARVLVDSLASDAADHKTFEVVAVHGPAQDDLDPTFGALDRDPASTIDGVRDQVNMPPETEPERVREDLRAPG